MSTAETFDLLADTLERRFEAGDKRTVLIMGAGFHHHLRGHLAGATQDPSGALWRLLARLRRCMERTAAAARRHRRAVVPVA